VGQQGVGREAVELHGPGMLPLLLACMHGPLRDNMHPCPHLPVSTWVWCSASSLHAHGL